MLHFPYILSRTQNSSNMYFLYTKLFWHIISVLSYHMCYSQPFIQLPAPGNQAAGRFLILNYFYGFLIIIRLQQEADTYGVARRQAADSRRAYGCVYMCAHVWICVCLYMDMYVHVYAHV